GTSRRQDQLRVVTVGDAAPPCRQLLRRQLDVGVVAGAIEFCHQQRGLRGGRRRELQRNLVFPRIGLVQRAGEVGGAVRRTVPAGAAAEAHRQAGALFQVQGDVLQ